MGSKGNDTVWAEVGAVLGEGSGDPDGMYDAMMQVTRNYGMMTRNG